MNMKERRYAHWKEQLCTYRKSSYAAMWNFSAYKNVFFELISGMWVWEEIDEHERKKVCTLKKSSYAAYNNIFVN
jgi:hypothetical protein